MIQMIPTIVNINLKTLKNNMVSREFKPKFSLLCATKNTIKSEETPL
jgi:hypothetical protein